jgi:hypothetical protein
VLNVSAAGLFRYFCADVRFGSKADIAAAFPNVRFVPIRDIAIDFIIYRTSADTAK